MKTKRYSKYLGPILFVFDLVIINFIIFFISDEEYLNPSFLIYINVFWIVSSFFSGLYKVYRHTKFFRVLSLLAIQFSIFFLGFFTYFSLFREGDVVNNQTRVLVYTTIGVTFFKYLFFNFLKGVQVRGEEFSKGYCCWIR